MRDEYVMSDAAEGSGRRIPWDAARLKGRLRAQHDHGLSTGALQPVNTLTEEIVVGDIRFVVRVLASLSRKEKALKQQRRQADNARAINPFLPYEEDLYVSDISETHLCLLNKFNVVDYHFLIVTRQFEPQENWLNRADFEAMVACLQAIDGLGFFNGGTEAGASQPHKHLQVVPYSAELPSFPMEWVIAGAVPVEGLAMRGFGDAIASEDTSGDSFEDNSGVFVSPLLPFRHAIWRKLENELTWTRDTAGQFAAGQSADQLTAQSVDRGDEAQQYLERYRRLLNAVGIRSTKHWQESQTAAYNLLCTREWMMVVPRSREKYANISVNSLGFAGSLLVRDKEKLAELLSLCPLTLLQQVGYPC
jgi:sulfate adenylyltransferase (ADP) / ATP adenylyltransferase